MAAEARYGVGWLRRQFFGGHYRALWKTPVAFPVLDLQHFAGGLQADKVGGGLQTRTLRFTTPGGVDYTFRPLRKDSVVSVQKYRNTIIEAVMKDAIAATHPAGAILSDPLLSAAGVLHPHPQLVVMPDDPALGKFRAEFAHLLGAIEEYPTVPDHGTGFAGAQEIIDSDELLKLINKDPSQRIDARAFLRARLMDMLLNDWDRHPGQWKWARGGQLGSAWEPISRDRDRAFVSYSGILPSMARMMLSNATPFRGEPPRVKGLIYNSLALDRRLLVPLEKAVWDSVAQELVGKVSNAVIDSAFARMPPAYQKLEPTLVPMLRLRRDGLPKTAEDFFQVVNRVAEIHGTDATELAQLRVQDDGTVRVALSSGSGAPYFDRRFPISQTREVRVYLHGGDDRAVVTGTAARSVTLRVIGGTGHNVLIDSSNVSGHHAARLYDNGKVDAVEYGPDTLFNRRPWITRFGEKVPPGPDYGAKFAPLMALSIDRDVGLVPRFGFSYTTFGFLRRPYARRMTLVLEHSTRIGHSRLKADFDQQREDSRLHWMAGAGVSDFEVISFRGLGNDTPGRNDLFFRVNQRQWTLEPAIGIRISTKNDLSFGPVFKYSEMDAGTNTFVTTTRPYGSGNFGQAGLALRLHLDERDSPVFATRGLRADAEAAVYPAVWDVQSTFGSLRAVVMGYLHFPVPTHPVLAVRLGGRKLFGNFPFYEAAFLGGGATVRSLSFQRYAGDTELDATAELRFRLANVHFILPLDVGVYPLAEAGRVWSDGESPGGWHSAFGGGVWIGLPDPSKSISLSVTNGDLSRVFLRAGLTF